MSAATTEEIIQIVWSSNAHMIPRKLYQSPLHPISATEQKGEYIAKLCDMSKFYVVHQCVRKIYQTTTVKYILYKNDRKENETNDVHILSM